MPHVSDGLHGNLVVGNVGLFDFFFGGVFVGRFVALVPERIVGSSRETSLNGFIESFHRIIKIRLEINSGLFLSPSQKCPKLYNNI